MPDSRTKNSARNASVATISKIITTITSFICRTVFIKTLGTEYLGLNGLFTNILTILSFAELGIGTAIIYKLYKPIAEDDHEKIKTLMHFYKKAYIIIGVFMLIAGTLLIPFLGLLIKEAPDIEENISFIYVLFLLDTSISYFFTYKKSIISGHQKEYIISLISLTVKTIRDIVQIVFLILTHNFIVYLLLQIGATLADNIIATIIANKMYPYIRDKKYKKIEKKEQKSIFKDVKSLIVYKLGDVVSNGIDNIIISAYLGVTLVGLLSNYTTVILAITSILTVAFNGLTASIGNLNTTDDRKKKEDVFYEVLFIIFVVYGYASVGIALLINKFITIWIGKEYLLDFSICVILALNLYIEGTRYVNYTFRITLGFFKEGRFIPLISSIVNIILSIILVKPLGIFGVFLATCVTRLCISIWYDPYLIHKYKFKTSCVKYFKKYFYYLLILVITFLINYKVISLIPIQGILGFIIDAVVLTMITAIIIIITTGRTKEFKQAKERLFRIKNRA